jgi:uncharacterized protein
MANHAKTLTFVALASLAIVGCASLEDSLLYHPVKTGPSEHPALPPLQDIELRTADDVKIHARWYSHPDAAGAILYCPGNAGNLEGRGSLVRALHDALGESVLIFDYPGYGKSEGTPGEAGCYAAADAAYRWLVDNQHVPPDHIVLYGESLGGGVAVEQASRRACRALVLVRTFASIPAVAEARVSVSVGSLVRSRFDSVSRLGRCTQPVLIAQADADRLIPFEHGERLRAACGGPNEFYRLHGLDHNDPLPEPFYARLREFLRTRAPLD